MGGWSLPSGIKGPLFIVAGSNDTTFTANTLKSNVFDPFSGKAVLAELQGVDHAAPCVPTSDLLKYVTAWFTLNLTNHHNSLDNVFYGSNSTISQDSKWKVYAK